MLRVSARKLQHTMTSLADLEVTQGSEVEQGLEVAVGLEDSSQEQGVPISLGTTFIKQATLDLDSVTFTEITELQSVTKEE